MSEPKAMWVFAEETVERQQGERPLQPRLDYSKRATRVAVAVPFESLHANMRTFLDGAHELLAQETERKDKYAVDSVEVSAQISADGKVGFLGSGVGISGEASVKFVFKRTLSPPGQ